MTAIPRVAMIARGSEDRQRRPWGFNMGEHSGTSFQHNWPELTDLEPSLCIDSGCIFGFLSGT